MQLKCFRLLNDLDQVDQSNHNIILIKLIKSIRNNLIKKYFKLHFWGQINVRKPVFRYFNPLTTFSVGGGGCRNKKYS